MSDDLEIKINDDLSQLKGVSIKIDGNPVNKKTIVKQLISFAKDKHGYFITMVIRGYETNINTGMSSLMVDGIALGYCDNDDFESMCKFFAANGHDIEVCKN